MNAPIETGSAGVLRNLWYLAAPAAAVRPGRLVRRILLGEPVLLGRTETGTAFALRDLCPHRAVPLSAGRIRDGEVECPYHGWRFRPSGQCSLIPSLVEGQELDLARIRVRSYPLHEANGLMWIFMAADPRDAVTPPPPPRLPVGAEARPKLVESQAFACEVDHAVVGLMDPAHGPFVHRSWWWRGRTTPYAKTKRFEPSPLGFTMVPHAPSSNSLLYRILGGHLVTEISFALPGLRIEHIRAGRHEVVGVTAVTPTETGASEVTQTFYWTMPWLSLLKPILTPIARTFLAQDRDMVMLQREGLRFNPGLMLIRDADVLAMWYYKLKREWADAQANGRPFVNPVPPSELRWRS